MSTVAKLPLSGSTDGDPIKIVATATPGTTVHVGSLTSMDTCFMTFTNTSSSPVAVTVEKGGTTSPDNLVVKAWSVPADGFPYEMPPELITNGGIIRAFAGTTAVLLVDGYVNRWTA